MPSREERRAFAGLLFTDVVGSTEIASEIGDHRWRVLLERHLAVLRDQLRRFKGQEIDTAGDGVFAIFDAPGRAIRCAAAIASAAREDGLELRSGIHSGEIERSGNRARGIAVHVAARAISYAGAGEIVVTQTVRDVVAGSPLLFETAGVYELKGVPGQWHLFKVVEIDGKALEPPLAAKEAARRRGLIPEPPPPRSRALIGAATAVIALAALGLTLLVTYSPSAGDRDVKRPSPTPAPSREEERLINLLPQSLATTCDPTSEVPPGGLAAVDCVSNDVDVRYIQFESASPMNDWFDGSSIGADAQQGDCATDQIAEDVWSVQQVRHGRVVCYQKRSDNESWIEWTDERFLVLGRASRPDLGDLDLYRWWASRAGPWEHDGEQRDTVPTNRLPDGGWTLTVTKRDFNRQCCGLNAWPATLVGRWVLDLDDGRWSVVGSHTSPNTDSPGRGPYVLGKGGLVHIYPITPCEGGLPDTFSWHLDEGRLYLRDVALCVPRTLIPWSVRGWRMVA